MAHQQRLNRGSKSANDTQYVADWRDVDIQSPFGPCRYTFPLLFKTANKGRRSRSPEPVDLPPPPLPPRPPMDLPRMGARPLTTDDLPNEILAHIFAELAGPPPSTGRLKEQPALDLLVDPASRSLKDTAVVCRRWRAVALPILFRHAVWTLGRAEVAVLRAQYEAEEARRRMDGCALGETADAGQRRGKDVDRTPDGTGGRFRDGEKCVSSINGGIESDFVEQIPLLSFLRRNGLASYVYSLTLIVHDRVPVAPAASSGIHVPSGSYAADASETASSSDPLNDVPSGGGGDGTPRPLDRIVLTDAGYEANQDPGYETEAVFTADHNWLWRTVLGLLSPRRFTLIATPRTLASLLARRIFLGDTWSFHDGPHILSLALRDRDSLPEPASRRRRRESLARRRAIEEPAAGESSSSSAGAPSSSLLELPASSSQGQSSSLFESSPSLPDQSSPSSSSPDPAQPTSSPLSSSASSEPPPPITEQPGPPPCDLFTLRPWHSVLLNEGPSTRAFKTYEFFLKRPPSILPALLGRQDAGGPSPETAGLLPPSIRDFAYVAIFPISGHFGAMLRGLPPLDRLYVQLVPRNDILLDAEEMRNVDTGDLWMERNTAYSFIMREMFDQGDGQDAHHWLGLRVFESGDAADREAWRMAVNYVEDNDSTGWRVERDGVFHRHDEDGMPMSFEEYGDRLLRVQFEGVAKLPMSSMWLYLSDIAL